MGARRLGPWTLLSARTLLRYLPPQAVAAVLDTDLDVLDDASSGEAITLPGGGAQPSVWGNYNGGGEAVATNTDVTIDGGEVHGVDNPLPATSTTPRIVEVWT